MLLLLFCSQLNEKAYCEFCYLKTNNTAGNLGHVVFLQKKTRNNFLEGGVPFSDIFLKELDLEPLKGLKNKCNIKNSSSRRFLHWSTETHNSDASSVSTPGNSSRNKINEILELAVW